MDVFNINSINCSQDTEEYEDINERLVGHSTFNNSGIEWLIIEQSNYELEVCFAVTSHDYRITDIKFKTYVIN